MIRVLIVDDQVMFRKQLSQLLSRAGLEVIGEAPDIPSARSLVRKLKPDLVVVDLMLPGMSGLAGIPLLIGERTNLKVVLVSAYHDRARILRTSALEAGAEGFYPKDSLDQDVIESWIEEFAHSNLEGGHHDE